MDISKKLLLAAIFICLNADISLASPEVVFVQHEQQEQAREREYLRESRRTDIHVKTEETAEADQAGHASSASFFVENLLLDNAAEEVDFLEGFIQDAEHRELTLQAINEMVSAVNKKLRDKGYITSRVILPEQNISSGTLHLKFIPGRLGHVIYSDGSEPVSWRSAFPIREGDLINIRLIEQGLEQMKRIPSQDVSMRFIPADREGRSDLELTIREKKQIRGSLSFDDSGLEGTGKQQWTGMLAADNVFNANDLLQISATLDGSRAGKEKGTRTPSFYYSIPHGKDIFTIRHNRYNYRQTVASAPYDFISQGKVRTTRFTYEHMILRNNTEKRSFDVGLIKRDSHSYINDMEIPVQAMDTAALEIGFSDRIYIGGSTLYLRAAHKQGTGWFGAQKENSYSGGPKTRSKKWIFDAD